MSELHEIPGIDPDKVERYGREFLKLVRKSQRFYEGSMCHDQDRPQDPNHENVIDISSDDADEMDNFDDEASQGERSSYFRPLPEVEAFNAQCEDGKITLRPEHDTDVIL